MQGLAAEGASRENTKFAGDYISFAHLAQHGRQLGLARQVVKTTFFFFLQLKSWLMKPLFNLILWLL